MTMREEKLAGLQKALCRKQTWVHTLEACFASGAKALTGYQALPADAGVPR